MRLPRDSGRWATSSAAHSAAPHEMPARMPSRAAAACAVAMASLVGAGDDLVEDVAVEHGRDEARADALDAMRARRAAREHRRGLGLDADDGRLGVVRLERLPHAGDRPAGPDAGDEDVDLAVERGEDLGAGARAVGLGVGRVGELVGQEDVVVAGRRAGGVDGLVHAAERLDDLDLRAVEAQQRLALAAHALGQEDRQVVALGRAAEGQRDAGVAGGRLDDRRAPRLDEPVALGGVEHGHADAVLDRAAGVEGLELAVELDVDAVGQQPGEPDHRRVADRVGDVDRDSRHSGRHADYRRPGRATACARRRAAIGARSSTTWRSPGVGAHRARQAQAPHERVLDRGAGVERGRRGRPPGRLGLAMVEHETPERARVGRNLRRAARRLRR